jgi:ubiquinone biosynthesis protein UbiJ
MNYLLPIEKLINTYLHLDAEIFARLGQLSGKTMGLELRGWNQTVYIIPDANGLHLKTDLEMAPDVFISSTPFALLKLVKSGSHHITRLSDEISVQGDLEIAQNLQDIFQAVDIDWEEHLSHLIGDVAAHQIGNVTRSTLDYGRRVVSNIRQTSTEYMQEELRHLPPSEEIQDFMYGVDETRNAVERLEARISQLERTKTTS